MEFEHCLGGNMGYEENKIEGRNAVIEAFRSGKTIDKLFVLDGCQDGPVKSITREARKGDTIINDVNIKTGKYGYGTYGKYGYGRTYGYGYGYDEKSK